MPTVTVAAKNRNVLNSAHAEGRLAGQAGGQRREWCPLSSPSWHSLAITVLLSLLALPSGWAAEKIGFFDSQRLLAESTRIKTLRAELDGRWIAKDKEVDATQKALQELVRSGKDGADASNLPAGLARVRSAGNPSPEKLAEVKKLNETLDRLKREGTELRARARDELRAWIVERVRDFARQQGYSVIFDRTRAGVVYLGSEVDTTTALIEWIDRPQ